MGKFAMSWLAGAALWIGMALPVAAQPLTEDERAAIESVMTEIDAPEDPGVAVGIVRDGEIVFERYIGIADLGHAIPNGPDTRFNIASNAKQYVALMALDLARQGRIDLAADFRTYLPEAMPGIEQTVMVENLITHTSGIRDIYDLWALTGVTWYQQSFDSGDALALLDRQSALNFAPGTQYLYSNSNYILLARLISEVGGERFDEYARGFFDRIGMKDTGWRRRAGAVVPDLARAYGNWDGWLEDPANVNIFGDGFLYTTLRDQLAWERQLQGAGSALDPQLLAHSQQRPDPALPGEYGYGLEVSEFRGLREISHVGSTGGYNAYVRRFPDQDFAVVVVGNTTQVSVVGLGRAVSDPLLENRFLEQAAYPAGPERLLARPGNAEVTGLYDTDSGTLIRVVEREGELYREIGGRDPVRLLHEDGNMFAYETLPDLKIVFDRAEDGTRRFRLFLPSQPVSTGLRLPDLPDGDATYRSIEGCYRNAETDTWIRIGWQGGEAYTMTKNGRARDATMVGGDDLRWNSYAFRFRRDASGAVDRLLVDNNRIRNVLFEPASACD